MRTDKTLIVVTIKQNLNIDYGDSNPDDKLFPWLMPLLEVQFNEKYN